MENTSEIVKFRANIPVRMKLKFDKGKPCKSQFNDEDQFMISSLDGKLAYLTPYAHSKLEEAGVGRGDVVDITKVEVVKGQRRAIDWRIERVEEEEEREPEQPAPPAEVAAPAKGAQQTAPAHSTTTNTVPPTKLEHALKTAIYAASEAEKYGQSIGYVVRFGAEHIKSMAISVLINAEEGKRR